LAGGFQPFSKKQRVARPWPGTQSWVYFIHDPFMDLVKIGTTKSLRRRFRELQLTVSASIVFLGAIKGDVEDEKALHKMFSAFRFHKEWFIPAEPIIFFVNRFIEKEAL
jgi:hypothetical protein